MEDRYFYSVETVDSGKKYVHLSGNVYENDADESETNFRIAEWAGMAIPIDVLQALIQDGEFFDYVNERVAYLKDVTQADAIKAIEAWHNGVEGSYLHINEVTVETAEGDYWFQHIPQL